MEWIYFSPHLDDIALSCGGLVWEQVQSGDHVSIWTIFSGDPAKGNLSDFAEQLHARWGGGRNIIAQRRAEDIQSCAKLGAIHRHFNYPDCIYRGLPDTAQEHPRAGKMDFFYDSRDAIFGKIHPAESGFIDQLSLSLACALPNNVEVICPLAIGRHIDHQITRISLEKLSRQLWYYADYPYILDNLEQLNQLDGFGWKRKSYQISSAGMDAWQQSVETHQSQISTFWPDLGSMREALVNYKQLFDGCVLWKPE